MKTFALIGAAGYIAPRHFRAIKDTGNILFAAMDIADSVGVLDSYFPDANFFTEFERFERYLEKLRHSCGGIDYLVVCTPNYLHDAHIRCGLRLGAKVICEKPIVVKPHNLNAILSLSGDVYTIAQLRVHPETERIKEYLKSANVSKRGSMAQWYVEVDYTTPRGDWYDYSWKGAEEKSGGLIYNIGIHLLDLMIYLFGEPFGGVVDCCGKHSAEGEIFFSNARVKWKLSTNGDKPRRIFKIDNKEFDYSNGFTDLHTECYKSILSDSNLLKASSMKTTINLADKIRMAGDTPNSNYRFDR